MSFHQDLDYFTRDMHSKSLEVEYMKKTPVLNLILEKKDTDFNSGKIYYRELDTDTVEDLAQDYIVNEPLTHGTKDTIKRAKFYRKKFQLPIQIDIDEDLENALDSEDGTKLHDLAKHKVQKAQEGVRLHLRKLIYGGSATDTNEYVQGLNSALTVDSTYGENTRSKSAGTNDWWQPADNRYDASGGAAGDQNGNYTISFDWLQEIYDPMTDLENGRSDVVVIVGNELWLALKWEAQARKLDVEKNASKAKFGIDEITIDGMRIVKDPFLQSKYNTDMGLTTGQAGALERRLYILNLNDWEFKAHPKRYFYMLPFFDQAQIAGGADFRLARIFFAGNLVCWHPNRSLYLSNVTP